MPRCGLGTMLGLAVLAATSTASAQTVDNGVVAYYPFNRFLVDYQTGGYNGVGSQGYTDSGASGQALNLGGGASVAFPTLPAGTFAGDFSLSWFMKWQAPADGRPQSVISRAADCPGTRSLEIVRGLNGPGTLTFSVVFLESGGTVTAAVPDGSWTHVAAVRAGNTIRLYVDAQAGTAATIPAGTNLEVVNPPLGLGNSPCIAPTGLASPTGQVDELRIYDRALAPAEVEQLARRAQFRVSPGTGASNAELRIVASGLVPTRSYFARIGNPDSSGQFVTKEIAAGESAVWTATLPPSLQGDDGAYLEFASVFGTRSVFERQLPFPVLPELGVVTDQDQLRAGRPVRLYLYDIQQGVVAACGSTVRVRYGPRVVAGPLVFDCVNGLSFVAPVDYPASFPAAVEIRVDELAGRRTLRSSAAMATVRAPYTGPFVDLAGIDVSDPLPRPGEPVRIDGQRTINDDTDPAQVQTSAFWVGNNGRVTSMPTAALAVDADGAFRLDTFPPSLGSMAAFIPQGPGRIRLVTRRPDIFGRMEHVVTEGPLLQTDYAQFLASDLRINVRKNIGGGNSEPIEGAFVVVDATAPLAPQPTSPPPGSGQSGWASGGRSFLDGTQPRLDATFAPAGAVNQATELASQFELPPPVCGESMYRRYTNAAGLTGFQLAGGQEETPGSWQELGFSRYQGGACGNDGCQIAQDFPWEFTITVYTLHRGAGYIASGPIENIEAPSRYRVTYRRDLQSYRIVDLRTNIEYLQSGTADIDVLVPAVTGADDFLVINDPIVTQEIGPSVVGVNRIGDDRSYGKWVEFTGNVSNFANTVPVKVVRFTHVPAVNGSITSAKLFLPNLINGQPAFIGDFQQVSFVDGCNIQDDPGAGAGETWELRMPGVLNNSWRFPRGVLYPNDSQDRRACGYIEVSNFNGAIGRRPICFVWQEAPDYFNSADGSIVVDDSDPNRVRVQVEGDEQAASNGTRAPGEFFGEEPARPGATTSRSTSRSGIFDTITANGVGGQVRNFNGNNPDQFSEDAEGAAQAVDFGDGAVSIPIGDPEFRDIMDVTIPLFQWYWGVPEILSAEVYARLRLLAAYLYTGTLSRNGDGDEHIEVLADALFAAEILIGVDIDVLFGFIVDAGASIVGRIQSEIALKTETGTSPVLQPCVTFSLNFNGYVDPCAFCPTPVIEFGGPILDPPVQDPPDCSFFPNRPAGSDFDLARGAGELQFGVAEARALRRHPALAFDNLGEGQALALAEDGSLNAIPFQPGSNPVAQPPLTLSPSARQAKLAYYRSGRAIAVWMESALTEEQAFEAADNYQLLSSNQRVAWATFDGQTWGTKQFLTAPGTGSAHPTLVACPDWDDGCPAGGEVFLAWQQNESGNPYQPRYRVRYATWGPVGGWTPVQEADPAAGQVVVNDMTPSAIYVANQPFVSWTRQVLGSPADADALSRRRLAYRHVGVGPMHVSADLPDSIVAPNLVAGPGGSDPEVLLTFVRPDGGRGPIGTELSLHVAAAQCVLGLCNWTWHQARDPRGRTIYGERPQYVRGGAWSSIVLRVFRFEGKNGEPISANDPIGSILSSGDLVRLSPNYANGVVEVTSITADGLMHYGHAAAYDPGSDAVVTMATLFDSGGLAPIRSILKKGGIGSVTGHGKLLAPAGLASNIEVRALPAIPDFVIESFEADSASVSPGATIATMARIANRGTPYEVARDGAAMLELRWNSPVSAPVASIALADLDAGGAVDLPLAFAAPASAHGDEGHTLYARIAIAPELDELSADNNTAEVEFAGLPAPTSLASQTRPGAPLVQLGWDEIDDPRIAGYRIYRLATDGSWMPLGASPNHGFLDISAQFAVPRTYAVSSYSARGVESERSTPITVMPVQPGRESVAIFSDGFEAVP